MAQLVLWTSLIDGRPLRSCVRSSESLPIARHPHARDCTPPCGAECATRLGKPANDTFDPIRQSAAGGGQPARGTRLRQADRAAGVPAVIDAQVFALYAERTRRHCARCLRHLLSPPPRRGQAGQGGTGTRCCSCPQLSPSEWFDIVFPSSLSRVGTGLGRVRAIQF